MEAPIHYCLSCPTSLQLRWAMNGTNRCWSGRSKHFLTIPSYIRNNGTRFLYLRTATELRPMAAQPQSGDDFAGWCDSDHEEWETQTNKTIGIRGRAGLVGVLILFTGLAFTGFRLSKRIYTKPTPIIEPVNSEETLLQDDGEDTASFEPEIDSATDRSLHIATPVKSSELHDSLQHDSDETPSHSSNIEGEISSNLPLENKANSSDNIPSSSELDSSFTETQILQKQNGELIDKQENSSSSVAVDTTPTANIESAEEGDINEVMNVPSSQTRSLVLDLNAAPTDSSWNGDDGNGFTSKEEPLRFSNGDIEVESEFDSALENNFTSSDLPTSVIPSPLHALHTKVLVPALLDLVQGQTLAALQSLKVVETDVLPNDLCTRREYARWLVAASGTLSRNMQSKVYPAMFIQNITELAFDDVTHNDPDFSSIQGLAEAGFIPSKLSKRDTISSDENENRVLFHPESPLTRQDLVCWKMALERKQLPESDKKILYELSGFRDVDRIHPDAWSALIADLSSGNHGIISLAFGFTRLFQPDNPVTNAQAAVALSVGEYADVVNEELTRIAAESAAENAVMVHNDLVTQVEKEINASFEKELLAEKEKTVAVEKKFQEALKDLDDLRAERERNNVALTKERVAVETEIEVLSRQRREYEEQLESILSNKVEISYEKERIQKLQKETEIEKEEISRLQFELEVEKKALTMARAWAEEEARNAREQANALEKARNRWEKHGIKVVVDDDLREETLVAVTGRNPDEQFGDTKTVTRATSLAEKLKLMADQMRTKSKEVIELVIQKILAIVEWLKSLGRDSKFLQEFQHSTARINSAAHERMSKLLGELRQSSENVSFALKEGARRAVESSRDGVFKLSQKFKA